MEKVKAKILRLSSDLDQAQMRCEAAEAEIRSERVRGDRAETALAKRQSRLDEALALRKYTKWHI